jgi:thiosulfate dehydrogenase (quinone) large subunit
VALEREALMSSLRRYVVALGIVAAAVLVYMENPWVSPPDSIMPVLTVAFWVLLIVVVFLLFQDRKEPQAEEVEIEGPAFSRYLFSNSRAGLLWLPIRIFLGFEWATAGFEKITGTGWVDGGGSLLGYWTKAVAIPAAPGKPAITFEWYRSFLQILIDNHLAGVGGWLIAFGELAVGVGLLVGALVGIAAFFGVVMNMSYLLAGSTSTNPIMFALAIGLILAWKVAGYYGVDRWLLPRLGVPWHARVTTAGSMTPQPAPTG